MSFKIEIVNKLNDSILLEIEELNKHSKIPQINTTPLFLKTFDSHLIDNWKPLFVKITEGDSIKGIIPLMWHTLYRKKVLPYRVIKLYASTFSDFHDIYAKPKDRETVINQFLDWLKVLPFYL